MSNETVLGRNSICRYSNCMCNSNNSNAIEGNNMNSIKWTPYLATAYAEGFCEGEDATEEEQLEAWAYLIKTGYCWKLQGWFGRTARDLIENEIIDKKGNIL